MNGISVLIPVYHFNPTELVHTLYKQCSVLSVPFEIIVIDDGSSIETYNEWSSAFHSTDSIHIHRIESNIGRAAIRNALAKKASFEWLLFLDADTFPCEGTYIQQYLPYLTKDHTCICGGTAYRKTLTEPNQSLRWIFGKSREELTASQRNNYPFETFTLNNLLIRKEVLIKFPLDASIQTYGHEDTLLGMILSSAGIRILHIDNFVYHEGLDTNEIFLNKIGESVETLVALYKEDKLPADTRLIRLHKKLKAFRLNGLLFQILKPIIPVISKNLKSEHPSLFLLDVFKFWKFEYYMKDLTSE
ncbi:MAG: glycosyltransferase family 2 protein [Cytophagales bacterium]|nr:glycosyltransferase family 2 protein [Cytophaga sp.]